jgi:hypothetical protein
MATGPGFAGPYSVFVPSLEASGRLVTGYSRNVNKFALPRYAQYVKAKEMTGYYLRLSDQEAARVVTTQEFEWPDGQVRPMHEDGLEQFNFVPFITHRYDYGFTIGWLTEQQATWPIMEQHSQIKAAQCMTARTTRALGVATTVANWQAATSGDYDMTVDHTGTASSFAGGYVDQGASTTPYMKIFLDKAAVLINQETIGVVEQTQLHAIMNPNTARLIAEGPEVHDYIKGSYWAQEELIKGLSPNNQFGLPSKLYGYDIVVENTVKVTSRKSGPSGTYTAPTRVFAMPDQTILLCARVGDLEGVYGAPSFSTLTLFHFGGEMEIEVFSDEVNRLNHGHVVENVAEVLTSPLSGFLLTSATSKAS